MVLVYWYGSTAGVAKFKADQLQLVIVVIGTYLVRLGFVPGSCRVR